MTYCFETGSTDPCWNLAYEEYLLERRTDGELFMLWQNSPTVVIGLNQNAAEEVDAGRAGELGITVVRRMTGGGAVYHDAGNLNYSLISDAGEPAGLSLARFMEPVCGALRSMGVPAEASGRNDITVEGLKVSGTARRIYKNRVLHHGTLLFKADKDTMSAVLRPDESKFTGKSAKSVRSRVGQISDFMPEGATMEAFRAGLLAALTSGGLEKAELLPAELEDVARRAEKYRSWDWTWGRSPDFGFKNSRRFPGGRISVSLDVSGGVINSAAVSGDFMASVPCGALVDALIGSKYDRNSVFSRICGLNLQEILGDISADELLDVMFG